MSQNGLELLNRNGIRFFVLGTEQDLFDPNVLLYLAMSAAIGSYQAGVQTKKSLENRIGRAKRGWPTCGKLPFGRTFDRATEKWDIDAKVRTMIHDAAARYLVGESMANLAREYAINHSFLHKTLTTGCGTVWEQRFRSTKLGIDETVLTTVPALLKPEVIVAVGRRAAANKTFCHGHSKHQYVFARVVFCGVCGYAMSGQMAPRGQRYYRHQTRNGAAGCPLTFRPWVPADLLEAKVLADLTELWGNPRAVEKALADAEPNRAEIDQARKRLERIEAEQVKIMSGRERILSFIARGTVTDEQAEGQLSGLSKREVVLAEEADRLRQRLTDTLSPADRKRLVGHVVAARQRISARRRAIIRGVQDPEQMTWEQKRMLVEDVFGGTTPDGRRMGIYVTPTDTERTQKHRRWSYEIRGRVQGGGVLKGSAVTSSSRYSPGIGPRERRFSSRRLPPAA
jgi:hypothetical protein